MSDVMGSEVITLRRADADDIAGVDALLARSYPRLLKADYPPSLQVTAIPLISRANPRLVASGRYYLAVTPEDEILGAGGWSSSIKGGDTGEVRHVVTDHRYLRQGIATRIIETIFTEARRNGLARLDCLATLTAHSFYSAVGFETDGPVTVGLRPGISFPVIRMHRQI